MKAWLLSNTDLVGTFSWLDANNDGFLTPADLRKLVATGELSAEQHAALFDKADNDHDGWVSLDETQELGETLQQVDALKLELNLHQVFAI